MKKLNEIIAKIRTEKKYIIFTLIALGAVFILLPGLFGKTKDETGGGGQYNVPLIGESKPDVMRTYEQALEDRLENVLSQIKGAGTVTVMLTVSEGAEQVLAGNTQSDISKTSERDSNGGTREQSNERTSGTVVFAGNAPVAVKEIAPKITGVLVVADGGGDAGVREALTRAASAATGVGVHRVTVVEKEKNK
jgi:stage III sporulation protein AG